MHPFVYGFYVFLVGIIRIFKWIELQIWLLVTPHVTPIARKIGDSMDVVFDCPGDSKHEKLIPKQYEKIIRIKVNDTRFFAWAANRGTLGGGNFKEYFEFRILNL